MSGTKCNYQLRDAPSREEDRAQQPIFSFLRLTPVLYRALAVLSLAASTTGLAALGTTEEDAYEDVTGETTWTHELPVEGLEEGTYNVLVRATDNAGNQSFSRATDIRIDPASDVPQLSVSIPEPGAVVGDRLLVLGTAVDDDAVASVFVGVNDDPPLPAEGAEYWSRQIDLSELEDGPHELVLSAVDENGTASPEQRIPFILDTGGPAVSLAEPAAGSTLGGRVRVSGTVRDPNGLVEIRFRAETGAPDGEAGSPQAADPQATDAEDDAPEAEAARRVLVEDAQRVRRRRPERDFSFRLDTRDIADGPIVVWVEATDVNGNTSSTPALYFVDNDSPGLSVDQLNNEGEADFGEGVPGELILSGRVLDTSGIASFTYQVRGEDPVEIPLEPGEADWLVRIDLTEQGNNARVDLRLTDLAGNTSEQRISVPIDEPADTPVIELSETADPLLLAGTVGDDDGVELLELQIDGQDGWTPVEHDGVFALDLRDRLTDTVPAGPLELQLRATDVNGRMSEVLEFERTVPADPSWIGLPQLLLTGPEDAADTGILPPRFTLPDGWRAEVAGEVVDGERPDPDRELRYRIDGGDWQRERPTDGAWLISLPRNQDPGTYRLGLELIVPGDEPRVLDRLASGYEVLAEGAALPAGGSELLIDDARLTTEGASAALRLSGARPLVAGVADRDLTEARLEPGVPGLEAAIQDGQAVVSASSTLEASEQVLVVTDGDGTEYRSASFSVLADRVQPVIGEVTPEAAAIRATLGLLAVPVSDETTGLVVEGALNGGDFVALSAETTEEGATSWQLALDAAPADGPVFIELRATDRAGNVASRVHALRRDTTPPEVALLSPGPGVSVNGRVTLALALSDPGGIAAVEWIAGDGSGPVELEPASLIRVPVILPELDPEAPEQLTLLVRDRAGNQNRFTVPLEIDAAADEPTVTIQLPEENAVVREPFAVSGTVIDDDGVAEIFYRVGEGPQQSAGEGTSFAFELNPEELGDNEQQIAVWARDPGGVESEPVLRTVRVSRAAPEGRVESPSIDSEVRGLTRVQGVAEDANGIGLVEVSIDNGVSFATALPDPELGWERWSYELDTAVLADGLHALQVRVQDSYETPHVFSHLVTVDNTAPELVLDEPVERHIAGETLPINGRALDGGEAAELEYRIQTAAGAGAWQPLELLPGGVIRREIEVPAAPEGAGDAASFNLRLRAADPAGNVSELSRTIRRATRVTDPPALRLVAPVDGVSAVRGVLVAGVVPALGSYDTVVVSAGDQFRNELEPDDSGYFWLELSPEDLGAGEIGRASCRERVSFTV